MMRRRALLQLGLAALAAPLAARAQKVHRIGLLLPTSGTTPNMEAFYRALQELGYVEGMNLVIERRYAGGRDDRYPELATELVKLPVDILLAAGPSATRAAHRASSTIPIVMGNLDPVEQGLIASLARPGGNITGWSFLSAESAEKQLSMLKQIVPQVTRVALVANPGMPAHNIMVARVTEATRKMGMRLTVVEVASQEALAPAFAAMARDRIEAFFALPDPVVLDRVRAEVTRLAAQHRLPAVYSFRMYADSGGLMSYGPSLIELTKSWATYVDKILKGAKPADLPVETPRKYELVLNEPAARALGLTFPGALVLAADDIIK